MIDRSLGDNMYTKVEEAIHFMVKANKGQKRKNENIDKCFHPMVIYSMLREFTDTEDVLVSALLHDIIDDTEIRITHEITAPCIKNFLRFFFVLNGITDEVIMFFKFLQFIFIHETHSAVIESIGNYFITETALGVTIKFAEITEIP